jgi:3-deoxy-D-manno-octulosonic-acid transferase
MTPACPPLAYRSLLAAAPLLSLGLSPFSRTVAAARRGRRESHRRFVAWAHAHRTDAPLVLWHAPSAGEWRQAEPVFHRLRQQHPDWQWALSYTSPSAPPVAASLNPEIHGYLPWDTSAGTGALLAALRPAALVFTKLDLWPELACQAARRGIALGLIAATVRPRSSRLRWPARAVLHQAYAQVSRAGAVSSDDATLLGRLGVRPERIDVLGDPRSDAVLERIAGHAPDVSTEPLLVAGSTWPGDELVLLSALVRVRSRWPGARLLIAPHVPGPDVHERLTGLARRLGLPPPAPHAEPDPRTPIRIVETAGRLALEYGRGWLAYVGGGFGRAGLHSVLEPAAWGVPVLVGPRWRESRDARQLQEVGALVPLEGNDPVAHLAERWEGWLADPAARRTAGAAGRRVVEQGRGAADRTAALLTGLMEETRGRA